MRRDVRESINEEIDKGLQGLKRIVDLVAAEVNGTRDAAGPLSSRLRKSKLKSA